MKKLLIIQVAALGDDFAKASGITEPGGIKLKAAEAMWPALTCSTQAGFRTAADVSEHAMPGNGYFDRDLRKTYFWEQSSSLVRGNRIWDDFAKRGGSTAMLFWQQSLGESADMILSPQPIHKHHGGIIENTYSKPGDLYERLSAQIGSGFKLKHYWGPMASVKSSEWIAEATAAMISDRSVCPDLCMTYLPALDYDLQRDGPDSAKARSAAKAAAAQLEKVVVAAREAGMEVVVFGDYAIAPVDGAAEPNVHLAQEGFLKLNRIRGMLYPDLHESRAFCMADHEIGHVYVKNESDIDDVRRILACAPGVAEVLDRKSQEDARRVCGRSGDLVVVAAEKRWIAYHWWTQKSEAPEYAAHVDIHNKPGYDPCELFFGWPPVKTGMDTGRVRGSHGKTGADRKVAVGSTIDFGSETGSLLDLSKAVKNWLSDGVE
jgi:predicted AlkP superfamily pyrophosphatase or phosphodiesterase